MIGDPIFDETFRRFLRMMLLASRQICARCGVELQEHIRRAFLGESDGHNFTDLSLN